MNEPINKEDKDENYEDDYNIISYNLISREIQSLIFTTTLASIGLGGLMYFLFN